MKTIFTGSVKFFDLTFYYINFRNFSSDTSQSGIDIVPIKSYSNADTMRADILKENIGKAGIYRWVAKPIMKMVNLMLVVQLIYIPEGAKTLKALRSRFKTHYSTDSVSENTI